MKHPRLFLLSGPLLWLALGLPSNDASADSYREINRLARRIDTQARSIARETRHFRHTPVYHCLVDHTEELRHWACHIRDHARSGYCLNQLQQDIASLGQAYAITESKFYRVERLNPTCNHTRRFRRMLNDVQFEIREMALILRSLLRPTCSGEGWSGGVPLGPRHGWQGGRDFGFSSSPASGLRGGVNLYDFHRLSHLQGPIQHSRQDWGTGTLQQSLHEPGRRRGLQPNWQQPVFPGKVPGGLEGLSFNF